jgi:hypothetical protein
MNGLILFPLIFWTTFAPLVLFLQILFGRSFQSLLQIVKVYEKDCKKYFQDLKFLLLFQMLFF